MNMKEKILMMISCRTRSQRKMRTGYLLEAATLDSTVDARVAQHTTSLLNDVMDRCLELDSLIASCTEQKTGAASHLEELLQGLELHGALESRSFHVCK